MISEKHRGHLQRAVMDGFMQLRQILKGRGKKRVRGGFRNLPSIGTVVYMKDKTPKCAYCSAGGEAVKYLNF